MNMNLDRVLEENDIILNTVIQIGLDEDTPIKEAIIYSSYYADEVFYFDYMPDKVLKAKIELIERKRQNVRLAAITEKDNQRLRIFKNNLSFELLSSTLDSLLVENKINPFAVNLLNINVDSDITNILSSADMLFKLGLNYIYTINVDYDDDIAARGFKKIDKGLWQYEDTISIYK